MSRINPLADARVRGWIYLVTTAMGAFLVVYGVVHDDWDLIYLGLPMLGFALPAYHTPQK